MAGTPLGDTYYPSCVVSLKIRFDEALHLAPEPVTYTVNDLVMEGVGPAAPNPMGESLILGTGPEAGTVSLVRVPKSANVELPAIRKAGTFKLTFDFRDLPLDPRTVRSVGVEIYMGSVLADDFASGVTQVGGKQRTSMLMPAARTSLLQQNVKNLVLKGLADSWHVSHTGGGSTVSIEGRDLTGIFLNTPITPELVAGVQLENRQIDQVITDVVSKLPWAQDLQVIPAPAQLWPTGVIPKLADLNELRLTNTRVRQGAKGKKVRVSAGANQDKMNFWDLVTRYCFLVGAIPTMTLAEPTKPDPTRQGWMSTIYIQPTTAALDVQRLFAQGKLEQGDFRIPFADNTPRVVEGREFVIRRMIFGRNIEDMQVERKFSGKLPKVIEVISYDTSSNRKGKARLLTARSNNMQSYFPDLNPNVSAAQRTQLLQAQPAAPNAKASGRTGVSPAGNIGKEDVLRIPVPGIRDQRQLQAIANALYTEISRGEMGGSVKTRSLASFGAGNEDPDLIHLRPGDGINLAVDARPLENRAPAVHPLVDQTRMSSQELMQDMVDRLGVDPNLARVIVASLRNQILELQSTYRVNTVKFDWDVSRGISLSFDYHNFIDPRNSIFPTAPEPKTRGPVSVASGPQRRR